MTIQPSGPFWEIHCDACPMADARDRDDFETFRGFVQEMQRAGWVAAPPAEGSEWEHYCPDCAAQRQREEFRAFTPKSRRP